jgi:hypothetical protein
MQTYKYLTVGGGMTADAAARGSVVAVDVGASGPRTLAEP